MSCRSLIIDVRIFLIQVQPAYYGRGRGEITRRGTTEQEQKNKKKRKNKETKEEDTEQESNEQTNNEGKKDR